MKRGENVKIVGNDTSNESKWSHGPVRVTPHHAALLGVSAPGESLWTGGEAVNSARRW